MRLYLRKANNAATDQMAAATNAISFPSYGHPLLHWRLKYATHLRMREMRNTMSVERM